MFVDSIVQFVREIFPNDFVAVFIISMLPLIEVKGAIPIAIGMGIQPIWAFALSLCGSLLICPLVLLFFRPILSQLKKIKLFGKLVLSVENMFIDRANKVENDKKSTRKKQWLIFLFVAVPLPLTGVWTGSGVATFLNKEYRYSLPPIILGNVFEAILFTLISGYLGYEASNILLIIVSILMVISIGTIVYKISKSKKSV